MSITTVLAKALIDPRYRRVHVAVIGAALVLHLSLHYATYLPALREPLGGLPYFRLHSLHEAEFLLIVAYAGVVLGLRAGLIAVAITGATSIPFILTPYIFGRAPRSGEIRDLAIQVVFILAIGLLITLLYDRDQRRRAAESHSDTLREVDRVRNNFMSIAAHELRTPMTSLLGFSELLMERDVSQERQQQWLRTINEQSRRLSGLIEELMSVVSIESGRLELNIERQGVDAAIEAAVRGSVSPSDRHPILVELAEGLPDVAADRDKLVQVLVNLMNNAVKYSPSGGHVRLRGVLLQGDLVRLEIEDHGLGIAPEDQEKLFTSFHRVKTPETTGIPGSGLGLSIVRSLVEMMGGTIDVASVLGQGSTFGFTLPVWQGGTVTPMIESPPTTADRDQPGELLHAQR